MEEKKRLARAQTSVQLTGLPAMKPGYQAQKEVKFNYHKTVEDIRYFYQNDPIAGTVINRICEIAVTNVKNRRKGKQNKAPIKDEIIAYYDVIASYLKVHLKQMALEYILHGMALPEYTTERKMGSRATEYLGRTRYHFPNKFWHRSVDNIELIKLPTGADRLIYLKIPPDEIRLVKEKGGKDKDKQAFYQLLVDQFPEYVAAIEAGKTRFAITNIRPLYRKLTSYNVYPLPYLLNALDPMRHKSRLKDMDMSITSRIIEAVRQIKVGNDEYPADDEDIKAEQQSFIAYASSGEKIFNYFTNHAVEIAWSYPPFEALLSEDKYREPNLEIFFALGFPRIWVTGETEKSNSADNSLASLGPLATINDVRDSLIEWVRGFYEELAELNGFDKVPEPYFTPINMADIANLIQYAKDFFDKGAISLDTISALYNSDYETELEQRRVEKEKEQELLEQFAPPIEEVPVNENTPIIEESDIDSGERLQSSQRPNT